MTATTIAGLVLEPLESGHAGALHALMQDNRAHLTEHGDYAEQLAAPEEALRAELADIERGHRRFGLVLNGVLVGRMDLIAIDPPRYSVGYWLAETATGQGYATAGLSALVDFARNKLGASDLYAGVTHGNVRSVRLLGRVGFVATDRFETYMRFHLSLAGG